MADKQLNIQPSSLEIKLGGKILAVEEIQGKTRQFYASTVVIPAVDQFSRPKQFIVNSRLPFGSEGDIVDLTVYVAPQWRRSKDNRWFFSASLWKDKPEH